MTTLKETARCPVCGETHEIMRLWFNGASQVVIPCPQVDRDTPILIVEPASLRI